MRCGDAPAQKSVSSSISSSICPLWTNSAIAPWHVLYARLIMPLLLLSVALAMILGFAANRASICAVRAVAEVISSGNAHMLRSIVKSVMWVLAITIPIIWLVPGVADKQVEWELSRLTLIGGFVYGMGATLNGACAFSTLNQLADGRLRMLMTPLGFCLGVISYLQFARSGKLPLPISIPPPTHKLFPWAVAAAIGLMLWCIHEIRGLWRTRAAGSRIEDLVLSHQYRLSTAAALIGLCNSILYIFYGAWSYTSTLEHTVEHFMTKGAWPWPIYWTLFGAMFAGMLLSTWQRNSFHVDWRPSLSWFRNLTGGTLMGVGAVLIPGGNDTLVLHGIPSFSAHAVPAYLAVLAGIFATLMAMRRGLAMEMNVDCTGDICVVKEP